VSSHLLRYILTKKSQSLAAYRHIDALFSGVFDWQLIQTHLPDILRVVLYIKAGRITASKAGELQQEEPPLSGVSGVGKGNQNELFAEIPQ
jgi:hypothetical protein